MSDIESVSSELKKLAEKLLNPDKRNNLINFKDTKSSTVEILLPEPKELMDKINDGRKLEIFAPIEKKDDELHRNDEREHGYRNLNSPEEDGVKKEDASNKDRKKAYIERHSSKVEKSNKILVYNESVRWNPLLAVKNIGRRAKEHIEETGVNVAYIALGFVHWRGTEHRGEDFKAPILLVPILLEQKWVRERGLSTVKYVITSTGDDIVVNPSFDHKLRTEYQIELPKYEEDEDFRDLNKYFEKVGKLVEDRQWKVSTECKIGIFSFLKINMYRDIKDNVEAMSKHPIIRQILGKRGETESGDYQRCKNPLIELHNVVDADSSQIEAIEMAKSGRSFVLQGPPGTGKSQTITNIIAECLSDGKKILFVSEKLAALNVVYDKLKKARLSEFCLELHSHKGNKKEVIAEICRTLYADTPHEPAERDEIIQKKREAQERLDDYVRRLHEKQPLINESPYMLYERYSKLRDAPDIVWDGDLTMLAEKGSDFLKEIVSLLKKYVTFVPAVGKNYQKNPWHGYINQDTSYRARNEVEKKLSSVRDLSGELIPVLDEISTTYQIEWCNNIYGASILRKLFRILSQSKFLTPAMLRKKRGPVEDFFDATTRTNVSVEEHLECVNDVLKKLQELSKQILAEKNILDGIYNEKIYDIDSDEYHEKLTKYKGKGAFLRPFNSEYKQLIKTLRSCKDGKSVKYKEALDTIKHLGIYKKLSAEYTQFEAPFKQIFGKSYAGVKTDWNYAFGQINALRSIASEGIDFGKLAEGDCFEVEILADFAGQIERPFSCCDEDIVHSTEAYFAQTILDIWKGDISLIHNRCKDCLESIETLNSWSDFRNLLASLEDKQMRPFLDAVIENDIASNQVVEAFEKQFYYQWLKKISYELHFERRDILDAEVRTFSEKDKEHLEINKRELRASLAKARSLSNKSDPNSPRSVLISENNKSRRQKSIRTLFAKTGEFVQKIKPCFLMSPLSVSTFLDKEAVHFDVVIFDEASQVFPEDAIGAIYRADQLIVVGDSKQMPPSNFFTVTTNSDDDGDGDGNVTDFKSILDLCSVYMTELRLRWHYRSRYEQLIAFSNKNFYENSLITFPSVKADTQGIGVDYHYVENGVFNRDSHTNTKEAEYIVDLIYKNAKEHPELSLGVVAFSVAQQTLIDDLLLERRQRFPEAKFFSSEKEEPFFVKNLETVQGDERDTIIFSIAYGKDSNGQFFHNFGPLNTKGGERRLNVAVTRAKKNVQVVSSVHASDIDLKRSNAEGVRLLREYLDFAEHGEIALVRNITVNPEDRYDSPFEEEVCEFLRGEGYEVDTQVGCSGYRIDLCVKELNSSNYVLAIECDGATYHSSQNARDRDRLRQEVLERMGWKFYRVWSTNWFQNRKAEQETLLEAVEEAITAPTNKKKEPNEKDLTGPFETVEAKKKFKFPHYEAVNIAELKEQHQDFKSLVKAVLEVEAPLSEKFFIRRYYNGAKVSQQLQRYFEEAMSGCEKYGISMRNGFMYLKGAEVQFRAVGNIPREIEEISVEELEDGMEKIMKQNEGIIREKEKVYHELAKLCGKSRVGRAVQEQFDKAWKLLESKSGILYL